ncbi:ATP-binding protein [Desulfogranum marinum]|uniref:ATP-binding protein n=1 Tax=Desulfogranum marinum TaxID=453220 RepID=UPI0029C609A5|nr:ATP-binding protein [Desulfogranum marinum]
MQNNILFIDDDSAVLDALEWSFADEPYGCLTCKSAGEALSLLNEMDFAVVVSDQRMPEMSGIDFLEKIKRQRPETIRILMTAYQEMNIILNAVNKGNVHNIIFKPWDDAELKRIIQTAVDDYTLRNGGGVCRQVVSEADQLIELNQNLEKKNQYLMERLQQAQKMEALGNLASGIAHDFNNILFTINGILKLAMFDKSLQTEMHAHLGLALEASDRATDLVSQILSFSSAGKSSDKPVKLGPLVQKVLKFIKVALPPSIELYQDISVDSEKTTLEATKVYQILINLCSNAFDAIKGKKGIVQVSLTRTLIDQPGQAEQVKLLPGDYFCLTVSDNGNGIDQANMQQIFDPYFTTKRKNGGTGLGLALTNQIVQDHGGHIIVTSEVSKGSSFAVFLPLIEQNQD